MITNVIIISTAIFERFLFRTNFEHRRFQANEGAYHTDFWKFIDILKREQSLNHDNISQARAGRNQSVNVVAIKRATNE